MSVPGLNGGIIASISSFYPISNHLLLSRHTALDLAGCCEMRAPYTFKESTHLTPELRIEPRSSDVLTLGLITLPPLSYIFYSFIIKGGEGCVLLLVLLFFPKKKR